MRSYRYSRWDGTQESPPVDGEDLMDAMADDLASHGDFRQALRNLMRRGMDGRMGSGFEGIREMVERLRQQSRERLERYNLASLVDELKKRLDEIVEQEKSALNPKPAQGAGEGRGRRRARGSAGFPCRGGEPGRRRRQRWRQRAAAGIHGSIAGGFRRPRQGAAVV